VKEWHVFMSFKASIPIAIDGKRCGRKCPWITLDRCLLFNEEMQDAHRCPKCLQASGPLPEIQRKMKVPAIIQLYYEEH